MSVRPVKIRGLSKTINAVRVACTVFDMFSGSIRRFVPSDKLAAYDSVSSSLHTACSVLRSIGYADNEPATNAPWGQRGDEEGGSV